MTVVTNIQKYSIHDGDGIRTTVFFKGCPLTCTWCHNPETQNYRKQTLHDREKCLNCGNCKASCPHQAILDEDGCIITDFDKCQTCGTCLDYCVLNLREITGAEYTIEELVTQLKKDEMFYEESGGGVTLSGGEVMTQDIDYIESLLKALDRHGIPVAIDTCGYASFADFERILPYIDTFLYDIKIMNPAAHKKYTGVDNTKILENLDKLSQAGARIFIRIPVIKEINGNDMEMELIIKYLKDHSIRAAQINLLPYHNTGSGKYGKMGQEYKGMELHAPVPEEMEHFAALFKQAGFHNTKIGG